jgi:uncharacterized membrane protein
MWNLINLLLTVIAIYFAKESYNNKRIGMAMFWAALFGWDLHNLLLGLAK